jgi:hypothetical protein
MARECAHGVFHERSEWNGSLDLSNGEMVKERTTGIIWNEKDEPVTAIRVQVVSPAATWEQAPVYKDEYTPNFPLDDAFALATAAEQNVPLLVGDDTDWDDPIDTGEDIIRIS